MRNKFEGICYLCKLVVKIGEGHFERHKGRFRVKHSLYSSVNAETCTEASIRAHKKEE